MKYKKSFGLKSDKKDNKFQDYFMKFLLNRFRRFPILGTEIFFQICLK